MPKAPAVIHVKKVYSPNQDQMVNALRILLEYPVSLTFEKTIKKNREITTCKDK